MQLMIRSALWITALSVCLTSLRGSDTGEVRSALRVGVAEVDITPPDGFPMAGYYHERLADGAIDALKARAVVFRSDDTAAALVICDLIGIATDLSREVRQRISEATGIPAAHIVLAATHSHTAPDYMKELYLFLGKSPQAPLRAEYIERLIECPLMAVRQADAAAAPAKLLHGRAQQKTPVSFNRRFVMRDGSVRTWMNYSNPEVVRAAGPIDSDVGLLTISDPDSSAVRGVLSNFALHLDTVGGTRWSADYPYFIEQGLRAALGPDVISIFGTGCCGDINHVDPSRTERNTARIIGESLAQTMLNYQSELQPLQSDVLTVRSRTVHLPLEEVSAPEVQRAVSILELTRRGEKVDFPDHVTAYKTIMLDQMLHNPPHVRAEEQITWGLSRSLAGVGAELPADVTVITLGRDVAIVGLPGEVFVELGLAIKQGSPFATTLVIELCNTVETIYIPHRAAYAGGSYEVTNSALQPGGGELLTEAALRLLREAAEAHP